jgi:hypothetical protein
VSEILRYLPPGAHLFIALEDYETFIRIAKQEERDLVLARMNEYLELTRLPGDEEPEPNPEWEAGYQAAMAIARGREKSPNPRNADTKNLEMRTDARKGAHK